MDKAIFEEESNTIEYKRSLPEENGKWLKSIVSFSNTSGGKLIIGVEDSTLKIVGIDVTRSIIEQKIIESIYKTIEPKPIINIVFRSIEQKNIVIVNVAKENETPYHIKKEGIENGCYVRYGSTDQKATQSQIEELIMSRKHENYSNKIYIKDDKKLKIEDADISLFLKKITKRIVTSKIININKLFDWNILKKHFNEIYTTNGYMLLTTNPFSHSYIKLGVFSGITKAYIAKDEEITGSIIEQFDEVIDWLLHELELGYSTNKIRKKEYKVPEVVIRELIANAIIHRNYLELHPIRISIFKDRLEVFSPGTLYDGIQLEDMLNGISKLRNSNIGEIFYHIGIIEKWGSGIQRANKILEENSMNPLIFEVDSLHGVNVIVKFNQVKSPLKKEITKDNDYLSIKDEFTRKDLEGELGKTQDQARLLIENWSNKGKIMKQYGGPKTSYKVIK